MKLHHVEIENFRAIDLLSLPVHKQVNVLYGDNAHGKTSVLRAIAVGLGSIPRILPGVSGIDFRDNDHRARAPMRVELTTRKGITWRRRRYYRGGRSAATNELQAFLSKIVSADEEGAEPVDLPIVAYYDTDRAVFDVPRREAAAGRDFPVTARWKGRWRLGQISGSSSTGFTSEKMKS
jgi:predicted ATP-binding protein involved in virulence